MSYFIKYWYISRHFASYVINITLQVKFSSKINPKYLGDVSLSNFFPQYVYHPAIQAKLSVYI